MKQRAFTLIELLVVIAIIGLLSSVVLASLGTARARARDAKRASDLKQMNIALQLYAFDHGGSYPVTTGWACTDCGATAYIAQAGSFTTNFVTPGYIPSWPTDPTPTLSRVGGASTDKGYLLSSNGTDYKLIIYGTVENYTSLPSFADPAPFFRTNSWTIYSPGGSGF